jgi:hypothetical protein
MRGSALRFDGGNDELHSSRNWETHYVLTCRFNPPQPSPLLQTRLDQFKS